MQINRVNEYNGFVCATRVWIHTGELIRFTAVTVANSTMQHHLQRAVYVYRERGIGDLLRKAIQYTPIEFNNYLFKQQYGTGTRVIKEDWDTLVLLDACRYDMFERLIEFEGELNYQISLGSTSEEFLDRNFSEGTFHDTVYVSANVYFPHLGLDQDGSFHAAIDLLDEWDPELEIAHPETVTNAALRAHNAYPNKRVIVHYMQPHIPFIGKYGQTIQERIDDRSIWEPLRDGRTDVTLNETWKAYDENLRLVLNYVEQLLSEISGKVVLSADHGNMVGERQGPIPTRKMYGHPWGVYTPQLVKVPWFEIDNGSRRTVTSDPPKRAKEHSEELVKERLRSLGYKE